MLVLKQSADNIFVNICNPYGNLTDSLWGTWDQQWLHVQSMISSPDILQQVATYELLQFCIYRVYLYSGPWARQLSWELYHIVSLHPLKVNVPYLIEEFQSADLQLLNRPCNLWKYFSSQEGIVRDLSTVLRVPVSTTALEKFSMWDVALLSVNLPYSTVPYIISSVNCLSQWLPNFFGPPPPLVPYTHPQRPLPFLKKHKCAFVSTFILYLKYRLN
jgi:hypothetical protein